MPTGEKLHTLPLPAAARAPDLRAVASAPSPSPPSAEVGLPKLCSRCNHRYPVDFLLCPRDGTSLELEGQSGDPLVGRVLGESYQIVRLVGEGGMGRVYEARHLRLPDRRLAVKILQPEYARDADICARFQREAQVASSVAHPNVLEVYDVSKTPDGVPYIVCEFLVGEELGARFARVRGDIAYGVHVTRQVCHALAAAHAKGVVHRDMKPENVFLVDRDGEVIVKVIDFGISKAVRSGDASLTRTGMVMGTPSYMAPEQARGDKTIDVRADVYAVGAVLYTALTGRKPFDSDDPTATLTLVLTEDPQRPRAINAEIPEGLELVVQRAMAKDPRDRYASVALLDAALEPFDIAASPSPASAAGRAIVSVEGVVASSVGPTSPDPTARTLAARQAGSHAVAVPHFGARYARATIVLAGAALVLWLVAGLVDSAGVVVRALHDGAALSNTERVLVLALPVGVALTPVVLFFVRVSRVWANSVRTLELATDLRRTLVVSLATYAMATLAVHTATTFGLREVARLPEELWALGIFATSLVAGAFAGAAGPIARAFRRGR